MENKDPKLDKELLSEIAHANYLQHGPGMAMKMLRKDLDRLLFRFNNYDNVSVGVNDLENLEIMTVAITELFKFGFRDNDVFEFNGPDALNSQSLHSGFARDFRYLIASVWMKNKTLSDGFDKALRRLDNVLAANKAKIAEIDEELPYPGMRNLVKEFRGTIGLAVLSVLAAMAVRAVPPEKKDVDKNMGIETIEVQLPDAPAPRDLPKTTTVVDKNGVYADRSGVAHEGRVTSNYYGDGKSLNREKRGPQYEKAVGDFKVKVKEAFEKGVLSFENLFLEGEYLMGDVTEKKHEKAIEVSKEIDKDFVDAKSMKPLDFFKKIAEIVQGPEDAADYRNKNPYVSDAYNDPERVANCKARGGAVISKIQKYRPDLMKHVWTQEFGDHVRAVVLYEGKLYSMDGSHQLDLELREVGEKRPNFELLQDPDEVRGSVFMSFEDYYVKKFLGEKVDAEKVLADSRQILKQAGFDPHLIDEHTDVVDNGDMNYRKNDVFGDDDAIHGLSNYGSGKGGPSESRFSLAFNDIDFAVKALVENPLKDNFDGLRSVILGIKDDSARWPEVLEALQKLHHLEILEFGFENVADDSMYALEDEEGEHDIVVHGSNPLPAYEKNSAFAEGLAELTGVLDLKLPKLKNLSPELLNGILKMRSLRKLDLSGLENIPDYFWEDLSNSKTLSFLYLNISDLNKDLNRDNMKKATNNPTFILELDNVSEVKDWKAMTSRLLDLDGTPLPNIQVRKVKGIEKFEEGFVEFLLSPASDFSFVKLEGTYSFRDISEEVFRKLISIPGLEFDNPEVNLAYWKTLVAVKGRDEAMKILDLAANNYFNLVSSKTGGYPSEDQRVKCLDDLGIDGAEFRRERDAWLNKKNRSKSPDSKPVSVKISVQKPVMVNPSVLGL